MSLNNYSDLESIIDEELIEIKDIQLPQVILDLEADLKGICNFPVLEFRHHLKKVSRSRGFSSAQIDENERKANFVLAGGLMTRILEHHLQQQDKEEYEIFEMDNETDIDVFVYNYSHYDTHFKKYIEPFVTDIATADDIDANFLKEYRSSLKIQNFFKGKYKGFNIEFIFTNPSRIQCFDINNRNVFYASHRFLTTPSALEDTKSKRILVTSVHTPLNSLTRALAFEMKEGYSIAPESIQLLKWVLKKLRVNVSDNKIKRCIDKRKLTDEQKRLVYKKIRELIPLSDIEKSLPKSATNFLEPISLLFINHPFATGTKNTVPDNSSNRISNRRQKAKEEIYLIKKEAIGYDYPFHPDTEIFGENPDYYYDRNVDVEEEEELYWTKTFYDALVNYQPNTNVKIEQSFTYDLTPFLSKQTIYERLYVPAKEIIEDNALFLIISLEADSFVKNLKRSSHPVCNYLNHIAYEGKYLKVHDLNNLLNKYYNQDYTFDEVNSFLLNEDFLLITSVAMNALNTSYGDDYEEDNLFRRIDNQAKFLLTHIHLNTLYAESVLPESHHSLSRVNSVVGNKLDMNLYRGKHNIAEILRSDYYQSKRNTDIITPDTFNDIQDIHSSPFDLFNIKHFIKSDFVFQKLAKENRYTYSSGNNVKVDFVKDDVIDFIKEEYRFIFPLISSHTYLTIYMLCKCYPRWFVKVEEDTRVKKVLHWSNDFNAFYFSPSTGELNKPVDYALRNQHDEFLKDFIKISSAH